MGSIMDDGLVYRTSGDEMRKFIVLSIVHLPTIKVEASKGIIGNKMAVR